MKYYVVWVVGSCRAGNRNGGVAEFDTMEEADKEMNAIVKDHPEGQLLIIEGEEVNRTSWDFPK